VCYGFINPEVNHVAFWMRGCSGSKVCINIDFRIAESGSPISITDWCIRNDFFQLWISESRMHILNYGLVDSEWFFQLWMFCIFLFGLTLLFMYYRKYQSGRLPDVPIRKFTKSANPKIYRIS